MSRRVVGVLVSLALAAIGTGIIVRYVQQADERAIEGQSAANVLVVDQPIARGTPVADLAGSVHLERLPSVFIAAGAVNELSELEGRVTSVDLLVGEQLVAGRFVMPETLTVAAALEVPAELIEVTVELSPERVLGGRLEPGDLVAILASFQPFTLDAKEPEGTDSLQDFIQDSADQDALEPLRTPNSTHIIVQKVLVTNIQADAPVTEDLPAAGVTIGTDQPSSPSPPPTGRVLVTVALSAPDAEKFVFAAEFGSLWLARQSPESLEGGIQIQTRGTIYL